MKIQCRSDALIVGLRGGGFHVDSRNARRSGLGSSGSLGDTANLQHSGDRPRHAYRRHGNPRPRRVRDHPLARSRWRLHPVGKSLRHTPRSHYTLSVACSSPVTCTAVGTTTSGGGVVLTTADEGTNWTDETVPSDIGALSGVACPSYIPVRRCRRHVGWRRGRHREPRRGNDLVAGVVAGQCRPIERCLLLVRRSTVSLLEPT